VRIFKGDKFWCFRHFMTAAKMTITKSSA